MCLEKLTNDKPCRYGYVVVRNIKHLPYWYDHIPIIQGTIWAGLYTPQFYRQGKRYIAKNMPQAKDPITGYRPGFHSFHTLFDARVYKWFRPYPEHYSIVQVENDDFIAVGEFHGSIVTVAGKRKILREVF